MRASVLLFGLGFLACGEEEEPTPTEMISGLWVLCPPSGSCELPPAACDGVQKPVVLDGVGGWATVKIDRAPDANGTYGYCLESSRGVATFDGTILHTVGDAFDGPMNVALDRRVDLVGDYYRIYKDTTTASCEGVHRRLSGASRGDCP